MAEKNYKIYVNEQVNEKEIYSGKELDNKILVSKTKEVNYNYNVEESEEQEKDPEKELEKEIEENDKYWKTPEEYYNSIYEKREKILNSDDGSNLFLKKDNEIFKEKPIWFWIESFKNWGTIRKTKDKCVYELCLWDGHSEFISFYDMLKECEFFDKKGEYNFSENSKNLFKEKYHYNLDNFNFINPKKYNHRKRELKDVITDGTPLESYVNYVDYTSKDGYKNYEDLIFSYTQSNNTEKRREYEKYKNNSYGIDDTVFTDYIYSIKLLLDNNYSMNESNTFQNIRIAKTAFEQRDQTRYTLTTGNPFLYRNSAGNLCLVFKLKITGNIIDVEEMTKQEAATDEIDENKFDTYPVIFEDNIDYINSMFLAFFDSGNEKTITEDFKHFIGHPKNREEEIESEIFSFNDETLYNAPRINSFIINKKENGITMNANKISIDFINEDNKNGFVERWN